MKALIKAMQRQTLSQGILYILCGLWIFLAPNQIYQFGVLIIALYNAVLGIFNLFSSFRNKQNAQTKLGIFYLILALMIALFNKVIISILPIILGLIVLVIGISRIFQALSLRQYANVHTLPTLIAGLFLLMLGIVILLFPFGTALKLFQFFGIVLFLSGISQVITSIRLRRFKHPDIF